MGNALIAAQIGLGLIDRLMAVQQLQAKAASEARDITAEELSALFEADKVARDALQAAIETAQAQGR